MDALGALLREALLVTALAALPVVALATVAGALVALLQAATQIQEQTLTLLPKLLLVALALVLYGPATLGACARLFDDAVRAMPAIVRGSG